MCGKTLFGAVANGLWEPLFGCLMPLLSSPSLRMMVSPDMHCGKGAALASLRRRESAWGKSQEQTEESPSAATPLSHAGTFGTGKHQSFRFRFFFKKIKSVLRRKTAPFQAALDKTFFYLCWEEEDSEIIILSPSAHSNALARMP